MICLILRVDNLNDKTSSLPTIGCITNKLAETDYGYSYQDRKNGVKVYLPADANPSYGQCYSLTEVKEITNKLANRSSFNYKQYMKSQQIVYQAESIQLVKSKENALLKLKNFRNKLITNQCRTETLICQYQTTLFLGENILDQDIKNIYGRIGIGPLLAISGMHINFAYNWIISIFSRLRIEIGKANFVAICLLVVYSVLAGNSVSVNRAVMMLILAKGFKLKSIHSLQLAFLISFLSNPFNLLNKGYQLSYAISLFFVLYSGKFKTSLTLSSFCYLIALPLSHSFNYTVNFLAPITMLIYTKIVFWLIIPISMLNYLFSYQLIEKILTALLSGIEWLSSVIDNFTVITGAIPLLMWLIYYLLVYLGYVNRKLLVVLSFWFFIVCLNVTWVPSVHFIDVGQGDSTLIKTRKYNILIDSGENVSELERFLAYQGISKVDVVFISHPHSDHYFALSEFRFVQIDQIYELAGNQVFTSSQGISELTTVENIAILPYYGETANDKELIIKLEVDGVSYLFPGDGEAATEAYLVDNYCQEINVDVLKVPHHGSRSSSSQSFIDCVSPQVAVISSGVNNRYGHPHQEIVERYQSIELYNTQQNGEVWVKRKQVKFNTNTK